MKIKYINYIAMLALTLIFTSFSDAQVPATPDLDVLFIEQMPVYQGYWSFYPGNVPVYAKPGSGANGKSEEYCYTKDEYESLRKIHPDQGEEMTFTAHIANKGGAKVGASDYLFKIDGEVKKKGNLPALEPSEKKTVELKWQYKSGRHFVSFEVDPENKIEEICETNNKREDPTFGFILTITAGTSMEYNTFGTTKNMVGSYSFEDWCQAHIDEWREYFKQAKYPSTPNGVQAGVRLNYVFPEDNGAEMKAYQEKGGWRNWQIFMSEERIKNGYATGIDRGLIHELCHQCCIIDSYVIGLGMLDNLALDPETGRTIEIPYADHRAINPSIMGGHFRDKVNGSFSEHEAAAFDATMRRWNHHAGFGWYLFDMPKSNIVQFLDNQGKPLADAVLTIFQQWASPYEQNSASARTDKTTPKHVRLDGNGCFNLGENPYNTLWVVGGNCVLMYCVRAYGQKEYHFVDVREFNLAYWRGDTEKHVYVYQTNIAPVGSPVPPEDFKIITGESDRSKATLTWTSPADSKKKIAKYNVRWNLAGKSALHEPPYETIQELDANTTKTTVQFSDRIGYIWFTVTAVAEDGIESAVAEPIIWPEVEQVKMGLIRPIGTAFGPDGTAYVADSHMVTIFAVKPDGSLRNYRDTAPIGSLYNVTVTPDNRIFATGGIGWGVMEIDSVAGNIVKQFGVGKEENTSSENKSNLFGIASDTKCRLFVTERTTKTIQVYSADAKLLKTIQSDFQDPHGIGVTEHDGKTVLAVTDTSKQNVQVFKIDSTTLDIIEKSTFDVKAHPLCAAFDAEGQLYIGTYNGILRYEDGKATVHWQSKFNNKGRTVWGIAIRGDSLICTEGDINEKYWMKGKLSDFKAIEE